MVRIKRRQLIQGAGATLAALGLNQFDLHQWSTRYHRAVAQTTSRKLALLIGVNRYPGNLTSLNGCLTDVELQRELLIYRYGLNPKDILILTDDTDQKPTRNNLLQAFEEHLIKQAKSNDVVVFSYSGHGSRILDPDPLPNSKGLNGTLLVADSRVGAEQDRQEVQDLMGRTLFLLMYALQTDNVTVILDSCYSGGGTRGNTVIRAVDNLPQRPYPKPSHQELAYQEQWLSRLALTPQQFQALRQQGIAKGVALGSAQASQQSLDVDFGDFYAGAFTYLLTRNLWQQTAPQALRTFFVNLAYQTKDLAKSKSLYQDPRYDIQPGRTFDQQPLFRSDTVQPAAEAVVRRKLQGQKVEFWLGGMSPELISTVGVYELIDANGNVIGEVEQQSRAGLVGRGILRQGKAKVGTLLRESIRGIPANPTLRLGVDPTLSQDYPRIQSFLEGEPRIEVMPLATGTSIDYHLGRMTAELLENAQQLNIPSLGEVGSLGLFTDGLIPIEASFGNLDESSLQAIQRLLPQLKGLLANKILSSLANADASPLKMSVSLKSANSDTNRSARSANSSRGAQEAQLATSTRQRSARSFRVDDQVYIEVTNQEQQPLYVGLIIISSEGKIGVRYPLQTGSDDSVPPLAPGQTLTIPEDKPLIIRGPAGFFEIYTIASVDPVREAMIGLRKLADKQRAQSNTSETRSGLDPLIMQEQINVLDTLLNDLDQQTRSSKQIPQGYLGVNLRRTAAISTIVEVIFS
jgi:hypothetical protein